jgi:hypothetical protein
MAYYSASAKNGLHRGSPPNLEQEVVVPTSCVPRGNYSDTQPHPPSECQFYLHGRKVHPAEHEDWQPRLTTSAQSESLQRVDADLFSSLVSESCPVKKTLSMQIVLHKVYNC